MELPPKQPWTFDLARFALELFALGGAIIWGWSVGDGGFLGIVLAAIFGVSWASVWGVFRVRNDPPGKTNPPVVVPGKIRLIIELGLFGLAAAGWWLSGYRAASETLMTVVVLLYAVTWDRQRWLIRQ